MVEKAVSLADLGLAAQGGREARITGLSVDSREVRDGYLFAAMPGSRSHGGEFIMDALKMGAAAILTDRSGARIAAEVVKESNAAMVVTENPRQALAFAAALWFGRQPETIVAITGTNGKTSVASFTRQIWSLLGLPAANLGTTGVEGAYAAPLAHTTPEPIALHRVLADIVDADVQHVAMEASSHGLAQCRLDAVQLSAAAFTNLSQDHLDYHSSLDEYFAAKAGLFERVLPDDGAAVIYLDDEYGPVMADVVMARGQDLITVGCWPEANLRIRARRYDAAGQDLRFDWNGSARQTRLNLIGGFQAENVLMAAGLVIASGCDPARVFGVLHEISGVRGRMQLAATRENGGAVFVDYSHTPDALKTALQALRPHVLGRLIVVFGAGGDRDPYKRPMMGDAARSYADLVFVTDDNPRSENPAEIRAAILSSCPEATEVGDRAEAILRAVDALQPGDALLIAGKGHETGQIVGNDIFPFDDTEQASVAVAALDGRVA